MLVPGVENARSVYTSLAGETDLPIRNISQTIYDDHVSLILSASSDGLSRCISYISEMLNIVAFF